MVVCVYTRASCARCIKERQGIVQISQRESLSLHSTYTRHAGDLRGFLLLARAIHTTNAHSEYIIVSWHYCLCAAAAAGEQVHSVRAHTPLVKLHSRLSLSLFESQHSLRNSRGTLSAKWPTRANNLPLLARRLYWPQIFFFLYKIKFLYCDWYVKSTQGIEYKIAEKKKNNNIWIFYTSRWINA